MAYSCQVLPQHRLLVDLDLDVMEIHRGRLLTMALAPQRGQGASFLDAGCTAKPILLYSHSEDYSTCGLNQSSGAAKRHRCCVSETKF